MSQETRWIGRPVDLLFLAAAGGFALAVALVYVANEQLLYVWDFKIYWGYFQQYGSWFSQDFFAAAKGVLGQVRTADYHPLSILPFLPTQLVWGDGRAAFIGSAALLYLFPCSVLVSLLVARAEQPSHRRLAFWLALALTLVYAPFWRPTLRGLPDIVGLLPILGAVLLVAKHDFSARFSLKQAIVLGLLLWLPFVLRRWYAYSIVTLYLTLPLLALALAKGQDLRRRLGVIALNFFIAGMTSLAFALIVQWPLVQRILQTDYSHLYGAYQFGRGLAVIQFLTEIGLYTFPLFLAGLVRALREPGTVRCLVGFALANLLISFVLFIGTQSPSIHHNLPFAMWYLIIMVAGTVGVLKYLPGRSRVVAAMGLVVASAYVFWGGQYGPGAQRLPVDGLYRGRVSVKEALTNFRPEPFPPFRFKHYDNYRKLAADLDQLIEPDEKFTVLASSLFLNDDLMLTLSHDSLRDRFLYAPHSDLQNGLRVDLMQARYLVISDPVQTHLASGQEGITYPVAQLLAGSGFGAAYERVGAGYALEEDITAYIYRRTRPFTETEAAQYVDHYFELYPSWKGEYPRQEVIDALTD